MPDRLTLVPPADRPEPARPARLQTATVLLVEDHPLLAQSLRLALTAEGLRAEIAPLTSGADVLACARRLHPDVVLLDLDLGPALGHGEELVADLVATGARVLVVTASADRTRQARCVEGGATGVVLKTQSLDELVRATAAATRGDSAGHAAQRHQLLRELRRERRAERERREPFDRLTAREADVLRGLMGGKPALEIARESCVSEATVRSQIRAVLFKLGVHSQLAAVAAARQAGWSAA